MLIRDYRFDDQPFILELLRLNTPMYFAPEEEPDLRYYLAHELEAYFIVEHECQLIGCGGINFSNDRTTATISWDIVHPMYQGQGIGTWLLNHRIARIQSLPNSRSITVRTSQFAHKFYEKNGFKLTEIRESYWAKGFDLYHMEYTLKQ
ncbi:N-acetylglutamate synthase, GNAT family [Parapedobacter composti]|uniref:N-acetylglutamate synthase, GNAT family n=1 Tax=Parapedobacter composti TaxID=623281 RepID=A0A1I1E1P7_9SPHI|nr:GNAT family N-acetyltransferase [Parapedobacter composti]SFB78890.1 N-acetylglutamate synthase, GNAT family [Parapedobacter composti]